jgi:hypothetical protein
MFRPSPLPIRRKSAQPKGDPNPIVRASLQTRSTREPVVKVVRYRGHNVAPYQVLAKPFYFFIEAYASFVPFGAAALEPVFGAAILTQDRTYIIALFQLLGRICPFTGKLSRRYVETVTFDCLKFHSGISLVGYFQMRCTYPAHLYVCYP